MDAILPFLGLFVQHGYLLLFLAVMVDTAGVPLPAEPILFAFGFLARTGDLDLGTGVALAAAAAMAGDSASYWLGRLAGQRLLHTYCRVTLGSGQCVERAIAYHRRFGRATVVLGRFVMGVRAFLLPLVGSVRMPYGQFLLFDALGSLLWASLFVGVGYAFSGQMETLGAHYRQGTMVLGGLVLTGFVGYISLKLAKRRRSGVGLLPGGSDGAGGEVVGRSGGEPRTGPEPEGHDALAVADGETPSP